MSKGNLPIRLHRFCQPCFKVVRNSKTLVVGSEVGSERNIFSTCRKLIWNCLITKNYNAGDRVKIRGYVEYFFG